MNRNYYFCSQAKLGSAKGGPYLGVHLRRKDFIWGHREDVPSLKGAIKKIRSLMKKHKLDKVFVATDSDGEGSDSLRIMALYLKLRALCFLNGYLIWLHFLKIYGLCENKYSKVTLRC